MINLTSTTFFTDEDGEIETKSLNSIIQIILPLVRIFCGTFLHICRRGSCYKMLVLAYSLVYYIISVIFFFFISVCFQVDLQAVCSGNNHWTMQRNKVWQGFQGIWCWSCMYGSVVCYNWTSAQTNFQHIRIWAECAGRILQLADG